MVSFFSPTSFFLIFKYLWNQCPLCILKVPDLGEEGPYHFYLRLLMWLQTETLLLDTQ